MSESRETATFYVECGRLLRRPIRREIEKAAIRAGVKIDVREDKGLLDSVIYVDAHGDGSGDYANAVIRWVRENQ